MNKKFSAVKVFIVGCVPALCAGCLAFLSVALVRDAPDLLYTSPICQQVNADAKNSAYNFSRAFTLEDAWKASCRVSVSGARGTGTFVGIDEEKNVAVILTNYHVVTRSTEATLDFWTNGVQESVQGKVYARFYDKNRPADFALIAVNPRDLARINPPYVALAGADGAPSENSYIISAGCPKGRFVQAWKGKTLGYYRGRTIEFKPGPVPGQSGSGVLSYVDGELWLTAVLTWLIGNEGADDSTGGAIPISNLYDCLSGQSPASDYFESPIPPGAKECADTDKASAPCVLEFTQANCPPCEDAKRDVEELRALGVPVYSYDVATERGSEYVKRYGVTETPTFVLLDSTFAPVGELIKGAGKVAAIFDAYKKLTAVKDDAVKDKTAFGGDVGGGVESGAGVSSSLPLTAPDSNADKNSEDLYLSVPINLPETSPYVSVADDFRNRPAVYEIVSDVGFFEDSDARWQELKKRKKWTRPDEDENGDAQEDPSDEDDGTTDKKSRPRLGERLTDGAVDAIVSKVEGKINDKVKAMKDDLREKWEAVKFTVLMGFCFLLAIALLIAEGIVAVVKFCWRKISGKYKEMKAALEVMKETRDVAGDALRSRAEDSVNAPVGRLPETGSNASAETK